MINYIIRRLILLPITLFFIVLVNFIIINLAPGEPTTITEISQEGTATKKEGKAISFGNDERYLEFRERYGLTLPLIINLWPFTSLDSVKQSLASLVEHEHSKKNDDEMSFTEYNRLRIQFGDKAKYIMPLLLEVIEDKKLKIDMRKMAVRFFVRGATHMAYLGSDLSAAEKKYNRKISRDNQYLLGILSKLSKDADFNQIVEETARWYAENKDYYHYNPDTLQKIALLGQTRITRYLSRVFTLDFGTLRNDPNKTVISEVTKRFKYSLTLSLLPMLITFFFSQVFGMCMAYTQNRWEDVSLNFVFLILYAIPVFVVAPFLIEKVALNHNFPFTDIPIPFSGFTSPEAVYSKMNSEERLFDILRHIFLPIVAVMYGSLAASSRISRTAVLEVLRLDYVRTARAKGVPELQVMIKHVARNASITIVTSIAGSLGVVLGGSLIVEILFDINGFGKFFYDAVINRDYNVIMFSALAGAFLSLMGYLVADIAYTVLDPRVTLE